MQSTNDTRFEPFGQEIDRSAAGQDGSLPSPLTHLVTKNLESHSWLVVPRPSRSSPTMIRPIEIKMCQMDMSKLYEIGNTRLHSIQSVAHVTGVVKAHSNNGKSMTIKDDDPRMPPIWGHFNHLLGLGDESNLFYTQACRGARGRYYHSHCYLWRPRK